MTIKKITLSLFFLYSTALFAQKFVANKAEINKIYLDSVKKTFINDDIASCVDSLWMKELGSLDIYNDISDDIKNINIDQKVDYELSTELLKQRLAEMDAKSPFHIEYNPGLENIIKSFLKNRKKSFERLMAISEYYFPLFEEALAKQNVPLEIKYLAVVESALNPKAVSKMGATGLWQFMYQTGKQYKLRIDSYVDERSDPLKSSEAAAQYMTNMYSIFGDWDLVLASYNSGPGNVSKAIRRSGGQQNYWNIRKNLPKETQGYLPAFLATMYIYEYHKEHGIVPNRASIKHFETDTILIKKQMSFKQISDLLDVPVIQLQLLNPSYKRDIVPFYHDQLHFLRLPKNKVSVFASNENKIYAYVEREMNLREKPFQSSGAIELADTSNSQQRTTVSKTKFYTVSSGDNLSEIARKFDVSVSDIKKWNGLKSNTIASGKSLKIITNQTILKQEPKINNSAVAVAEAKTKKEDKSDTVITSHVVQKGDNLGNIAKKYNVSVEEIKEWNNLSNTLLQLGMSLQIAKNEVNDDELTVAPKIENVEYLVKKGDNLGNIAKKFGSSLEDLKQWNNLSDNTIGLGQRLIVAKNKVIVETQKKDNLASAVKNNIQDYYVQKGDSLYSISKKYPGVTISDIKKWNNIESEDIKPGMKLKIKGGTSI